MRSEWRVDDDGGLVPRPVPCHYPVRSRSSWMAADYRVLVGSLVLV
jgi:hypothetical protein